MKNSRKVQHMYEAAGPCGNKLLLIFSVRMLSVLQWCGLSVVDLLFKKLVMTGIISKKKKSSFVLKYYACS